MAVATLGLSALLAAPLGVAAAPPERNVNDLDVGFTSDCVAIVTWEPLQGGRPMFAKVVFSYQASDGDYDLFLGDDGIAFYKVQQNDGLLEIDLAAIAATRPEAPDYLVEVHFEDRKGDVLSSIESAVSPC